MANIVVSFPVAAGVDTVLGVPGVLLEACTSCSQTDSFPTVCIDYRDGSMRTI